MGERRRIAGLPVLLPAALTLYLAFEQGGYFPDTTAAAALVGAGAIAIRALVAESPLEGLRRPGAVTVGVLLALATWSFLSAQWAGADGRVLLELDRLLLYAMTLALLVTVGRTLPRMELVAGTLAAAIALVAVAALASRLLPEIWPAPPSLTGRLAYPLNYQNALALLMVVGGILLLHVAAGRRADRRLAALAAAAIPIVLAAEYFTFSRGALLAGVLGVGLYAALARSRELALALVATVPACAVVLIGASQADVLATSRFDSPAGHAQGLRLAMLIAASSVVAGVLRLHASAIVRAAARARWVRPVGAALVLLVTAGSAVAVLADDAPPAPRSPGDLSARVGARGDSGRAEWWAVAGQEVLEAPVRGNGAGTFELLWERDRDSPQQVLDAHSLYLEMAAELGLVGLLALVVVLVALLGALLAGWREQREPVYAAFFAAGVAWAAAAGVDWHWEMPAVTVWLFAAGGLALARAAPGSQAPARITSGAARVGLAAACAVLAVVPALVLVSETRLERARALLEEGDCPTAAPAARRAASVLTRRAEPHLIVGYCEAELGRPELSVAAMERAVAAAPADWETHFGLAVARASSGLDPREPARRASELNPNEDPRKADIDGLLLASGPEAWIAQGRAARPVIRNVAYAPVGE